jgi:hypothetical protein
MKKFILVIVYLFLYSTANAECITIDTSGWTQDQKNAIYYTSYRLVFEAGQPIEPTVKGDVVCVDGFVGDLALTVLADKILAIYTADQLANAQALAQKEADMAELESLKTELGQDYVNFQTKTDAEKLAIIERLLRVQVLNESIAF